MKLTHNKILVASVVFTILSFSLLLVSLFTNHSPSSTTLSNFFPEYRFPTIDEKSHEEIVIERIVHLQENGKDLRSPVYLTHHGYLLKKIAKIKVNFREKQYTFNDICYKPHVAIFEGSLALGNVEKLPVHLQHLLLEVKHLSPCLIVTPLNCFNDSYRIHADMSKWDVDTPYLNRKLRNSYIEAADENDVRPYIKSTYGPELIREWAYHMLQLPAKPLSNFSKSDLSRKIQLWLSSIEPKRMTCADPTRNCNQILDTDNYYNICMQIHQINDLDERRKQFNLDFEDEELTREWDCLDNLDEFSDWMQERELREMLKSISFNTEMPKHLDISEQYCEGIYQELNSSGLEYFHGSRSFGKTRASFDSMKTEIGLMTPENILKAMRYSDYVSGFESDWTIEKAQELFKIFRLALREEVEKFKENRPSKYINVTTEITNGEPEKIHEEETVHSTICFVLGASILLFTFFSIFVFAESFFFSLSMFLARSAITAVFFSVLCKSEGVIIMDYNLLGYLILHMLINLVLTARVAFLTERINGCIQSRHGYTKSNFSSLGSVDSIKEGSDVRQVRYVLAQYTNYQVAVDAYSEEPFEKLPKYWIFTSLLFLPIVGLYWFFVYSDIHKICIVLLPSFIVAAYEELKVKNDLLRDRKAKKEVNKVLEIQTERLYSQRSYVNIFSGKATTTVEKSHHKSNEIEAPKGSKNLNNLPRSSYDASQIMAYPNAFCRQFRFKVFGLCYRLETFHDVCLLLPISIAALLILLSVCLLFLPVQRSILQTGMKEDDLFIDFSFENISSSWDTINIDLQMFNSEIDSIGSLRTISNWKKCFDRFEGRINQNDSNPSGIERYMEWMDKQPIHWSLTAPLTKPSRKPSFSNPFQFRFRYEIDTSQEAAVIETVQKLDAVLDKYSETLSFPKAVGVLYEHYHLNAVVWNPFAYHELLAAAVLTAFFALIVVIFSVKPTFFSPLIFAFFVVGTRLELAAIISLFSLEYHQVYINFAVIIGFLAAWTPFCDLARFRARCLHRDQTRTTPELASNRRIRYPFIAAVDTTQVFVILFTAFAILAVVAAAIPRFNYFLIPTVIFIATQLIAFANSIAIIITTNRMFEHDVRLHFHDHRRSMSDAAQVCDLSRRKLLPSPPADIEIPMQDFSIRPVEDNHKFYGPPPTYPSANRNSDEEEDIDIEDEEGTSGQISNVDEMPRQFSDHTQRASTMQHPELQPFNNSQHPMPALSGIMSNYDVLGGAPMDASYGVFPHKPDLLPANVVAKKEEGEPFGLGGHNEDEDSYPSSGDDSGDSDKEREEVTNEASDRIAQKEVKEEIGLENQNNPGPSNRQERREESYSSDVPPDPVPPPVRIEIGFRRPQLHEIPDIVPRPNGRNTLFEPPTLEEYMQQYSNPNQERHSRSNQYPAGFDQAMVAYCEDMYWRYNQTSLPAGVRMPPRPYDWEVVRHLARAPPMDRNYVPPPGTSILPIPPEALDHYNRTHRANAENQPSRDERPGL